MAPVTRNMDENPMADEQQQPARETEPARQSEDQDVRPIQQAPTPQPAAVLAAKAAEPGFFTIYKRGQGYWTRMGTAAGAGLIGLLTAGFFWEQLPAWGALKDVTVGVVAGFAVGYALLMFWLMNKPQNVDFLISTDSEMKKVNWTSRRELIGSTKVVILFMFMIAAFLFAVDVFFGYFFKFIKVLQFGPFE